MKINLPNISFEVTSLCNLSCRYCYNHWKSNGQGIPTPSTYKTALNTIKSILAVADVKHITFTGGEPLMAERFLELVLYVRMKDINVSVISNGNFAEIQVYKQLVDMGVGLFELPVHSHQAENHDKLTNHVGSWQKSVDTIANLLTFNADVVAVIVLTKLNHTEVDKTIDFIHSLGIKRIMVNRFNVGGQGINHLNELMLTRTELAAAFTQISAKARHLKLSVSSNVCTPICVLNPKDFRGVRFSSCSFEFTERPITLDDAGNLRFCNHSPVVLGNIHKTSLDTIFKSDAVMQWKTTVPQFCSDCKAYPQCKGGCRAASEQMGLTLNSADPILNFVEVDKGI